MKITELNQIISILEPYQGAYGDLYTEHDELFISYSAMLSPEDWQLLSDLGATDLLDSYQEYRDAVIEEIENITNPTLYISFYV